MGSNRIIQSIMNEAGFNKLANLTFKTHSMKKKRVPHSI